MDDILLRALSPMQQFLQSMSDFIYHILQLLTVRIIPTITSEPLFMWIFGFIALSGAIGVLGRLLSRE